MKNQLRLLFVEDSENDVELALGALRRDGLEALWQRVDSEVAMRQALATFMPEAILSDFSMPHFDGLSALRLAREMAPDLPFIFLSGTIGEERAIEAIRLGAIDYVLKDNMRRLGTSIKRALDEALERERMRRAYEVRIKYLANYDPLSGMPNRSLLGDRAAQAIAQAKRSGHPGGLIVLSIDRFKLLSDSYGHSASEALLKMLAGRIVHAVRGVDTVARVDAEVFAVLAVDLGRPDDLVAIARKIHECTQSAFSVEDRSIHVALSIGASTFPSDGDDVELLLRNASAAMHRAKQGGGNSMQFYTESMTREATERIEIEADLRTAIEARQLELHYQPQVSIGDGRIVGVEALMRWKHALRGHVSPGVFVPIAEDCGLIQALGMWGFREACRQLGEWSRAGQRLRMAVNVSAQQFRSDGFAEAVGEVLRASATDPALVELELTESALIEDREKAISILQRLKNLGMQIAVDDFGTGYSSLSYLSGLPVDCLKIDRSFVAQTTAGGRDAAIAQAIISLGHALGLRVLAEGVESAGQLQFLRQHQCDECQGYFISRPRPAGVLLGAGSLGPAV
jgi:diguanylate cyclase (GGDEF)-like protein